MFSRAHMILDAFDKQAERNDNEIPQDHQPKESYVIHTPEPGDDDYEGLSEVVEELLKENPLICKWR